MALCKCQVRVLVLGGGDQVLEGSGCRRREATIVPGQWAQVQLLSL